MTGGSGMIGSHLVRRLIAEGHSVSILTRQGGCPARLRDVADQLTMLTADLTAAASVELIAATKPELVFHLASTPFNPPPCPEDHLRVNVLGTHRLLEGLAGGSVRRIVFAGSAAQYGSGDALSEDLPDRPDTLLGASKCGAAALLHAHGRRLRLSTVELRLFTPYGPGERPNRLVPHTIGSAMDGRPVLLSSGRQERDFTYIEDVTDALVRAMKADLPPASVINICSGQGIRVRSLVERILSQMGDPVPLRLDALPTRADEIWKLSGSNQRARSWLGWAPQIDLEEGLRRTIAWMAENREMASTLT
jgi:nucleoside-diphosphate-sugar epimerase